MRLENTQFQIKEVPTRVKGKPDPTGKKTLRVGLGDKEQRYVAVKVIDENSGSLLHRLGQQILKFWFCYLNSYVETGLQYNNDKTVLLSVHSLSKRLKLDQKVIWEAAKKERGIYNLIINRTTDLLAEEDWKAAHKQDVPKQKKSMSPPTEVIKKKIIDKATEIKLVTILVFNEILKKNKVETEEDKNEKTGIQLSNVSVEDRTYSVQMDPTDNTITSIYRQKFVIDGGQGKIYRVKDLLNPKQEEQILKVSKDSRSLWQRNANQESIKKEYEILKEINPNGDLEGIQEPPHKFMYLKDDKTAYITKKYDMDYFDDINFYTKGSKRFKREKSKEQRYNELHQLLQGLKHLKAKKIVNTDIKTKNIFIKGNKAVLADFGGCVKTENLSKTHVLSHTFSYVHSQDRKYLMKPNESDLEKYNAISVFQLGLVMSQAFVGMSTKDYPFQLNLDDGICIGDPVISDKIPEEIRGLIKEMLDPDYTKRPTIEQALERFEKLTSG